MPLHSCALAKAGIQFSLFNVADVMAGYHYGSNSRIEPSYATVGLGVNIKALRLGAAYVIPGVSSALENTLAFSLGARF